MEQKRTLWIVLTSGIFLLVVIGAALILYAPQKNKKTDISDLRDEGSVWINPSSVSSIPSTGTGNTQQDYLSDSYTNNISSTEYTLPQDLQQPEDLQIADASDEIPSEVPGSAQGLYTTTDNLTVISTGTTNVIGINTTTSAASDPNSTTIDLNTLKNTYTTSSVTPQNQAAEEAMRETENSYKVQESKTLPSDSEVAAARTAEVTVPAESTAASSSKSTTVKPASSKSSTSAKSSTSSKSTSSSEKSTGSSKKNTTSAKSSDTKAAASKSSAETTKVPDRFWVQAASYSSRKNADEARAVLDANKIQCEVFTYTDANGNLYYRVRVGPFTTKSEAEYWKQKIDAIELFAKNNSYITNTSAPTK